MRAKSWLPSAAAKANCRTPRPPRAAETAAEKRRKDTARAADEALRVRGRRPKAPRTIRDRVGRD